MGEHRLNIDDKKRVTVTEVTDVDAFDERSLWANLKDGGLEIAGDELSIERLELQDGILVVTGTIESVTYTDRAKKPRGRFFGRRKADAPAGR